MTPDGPGAAGLDQETGVLGGLSLARGSVDRASHRRADAEWIAAAWADEASRVLVCSTTDTRWSTSPTARRSLS